MITKGTELQIETPKTPGFVNTAIAKVKTVSPFNPANPQAIIEVEVVNYSPSDVSGTLDIFIAGAKADGRRVALKPFETCAFRHILRLAKPEPSACRSELSIKDELPQDNIRHFALNPGETPVILATPEPSGREDFLKMAFVTDEVSKAADFRIAGNGDFKNGLSRATLAIIRDGLNQENANAVMKFLEGGGTAVAIWRDRADMRSLLLRFGVKVSSSSKKSTSCFGEIDFDSPLFKRFMEAKIGGLFEIRFFNAPTLTPPAETAKTIASFNDGRPAILELTVGKGRLIVIASSMDRRSTDWPASPSFLPFWRELLASCRQQDDSSGLEIQTGAQCALKTPEGNSVDTAKPGCVKVSCNGRKLYASINTVASESNPATLPESFDLKKLSGKEDILQTAQKPESSNALDENGSPLWHWLLLLALLCALGELAISNRTAL